MPSHPRQLPCIGVACVLALLLSAYALAPNRAAAAHAQTAMPQVSGAVHFIQTATSPNLTLTYINNPATNNKPNAFLLVTPNWNPGGNGGIFDPHPIGVYYNTVINQWAIFNEDEFYIPQGAAFNVLVVPKAGGSVFLQTATSSNTLADFTLINNPATNGKPSAKLFITQNLSPAGSPTFNSHNVGVFYDLNANEWAVFNEDGTSMPIGAAFNVLVGAGPSGGGKAFLQTATASNTYGDSTFLDNSVTNWDPNATVFVTQNWNPNGACGCIYDTAALGVWYEKDRLPAEWAVFNEDGTSMPIGASFNVLAFSS